MWDYFEGDEKGVEVGNYNVVVVDLRLLISITKFSIMVNTHESDEQMNNELEWGSEMVVGEATEKTDRLFT